MSGKLPSPTVRMLTCVNYVVDAGPTVKGCLSAMSQHVSTEGLVYLHQERIAHMAGYTSRAVRVALHEAETRQYIKTTDRGRGRSRVPCYRVLLLDRYDEAVKACTAWTRKQEPHSYLSPTKQEPDSYLEAQKQERRSLKQERGSAPIRKNRSEPSVERVKPRSTRTSKDRDPELCALSIWLHSILMAEYPAHRQKNIAGAQRWLKINKPDEATRAAIMVQLERWKESAEWRRDHGQYVPDIAAFLDAPKYRSNPPDYRPPTQDNLRTEKEVWH